MQSLILPLKPMLKIVTREGSPGNKIPYVPEVQYNIRLGLVYENWSSFFNYRWQDEVYTDAANSSIIDDYGTLDWSGFLRH